MVGKSKEHTKTIHRDNKNLWTRWILYWKANGEVKGGVFNCTGRLQRAFQL